ncbi:MAG: amidase domain-containing protein, partial [Chloroflexota bacterium]|nr:amidase domain-containing protein [Chloroflexota bacterium]
MGYPPPRYHYYHSQAAAYINTWTKNTSITCSTDPVVYQNQSNWNPAYQKHWCNDCANYVSQALKAGGCTTTSTWKPYTDAWSNVYWLQKFLIDDGRGYWTTSYLQLQAGDIAFIKKDNPER